MVVSHARHAVINLSQASVAFFAPIQKSDRTFILVILIAILVTYPASHLGGETWNHVLDSFFLPLVPLEGLCYPDIVSENAVHEILKWFRNACKITHLLPIFVTCIPYEAAVQQFLSVPPSHIFPFRLSDMTVQQFKDFFVPRDTVLIKC